MVTTHLCVAMICKHHRQKRYHQQNKQDLLFGHHHYQHGHEEDKSILSIEEHERWKILYFV